MEIVILSLLFVGLFLTVFIFGLGFYLSEKLLHPKMLTSSEENTSMKDWEEVSIRSEMGYPLYGYFLKGQKSDRVIIFNHGISLDHISGLKYREFYEKMGFSILLHDFRGHGRSGGDTVTYGFHEKVDMKSWVDWLTRRNPDLLWIGVHGESMGSAIGIEHSYIDPRVGFVISDCGYSDLWDIIKYRIAWELSLPEQPSISLANWWTKRRVGLDIKEVSPREKVKEIPIPILFIHGEEDRYTPLSMTREMYDNKLGEKDLWLVKDSKHIGSYLLRKEEYEERLKLFFSRVGILIEKEKI